MDIFSTDVNGISFKEDYPNNILTIKDLVDVGESPTILLSKTDTLINVFCAVAGGIIGHLPYSVAELVDKQVQEGVVFKSEKIEVYFLTEDVEGLRPRLNITFVRESD